MDPRNPADALIVQLLEWLEAAPRTHTDVVETWRTTCPRLSIWEDACIAGLVDSDPCGRLRASARGRTLLENRG